MHLKKIRMASKAFTSSLVYTPTSYSSKYHNLSANYVNDNAFNDSYLYGLRRQHNFLTSKAVSNSLSTFFNLSSVDKIIQFN
jgi:hypothetical protein